MVVRSTKRNDWRVSSHGVRVRYQATRTLLSIYISSIRYRTFIHATGLSSNNHLAQNITPSASE